MIQNLDWSIALPALALSALGVAMVYSATFSKTELSHLYLKQMIAAGAGMLGLMVLAAFHYHSLLERYAYPAFWMVCLLLAVVLAAGTEISGSKRWFVFGPISLQPSEFAKVITTLVLARYLALREARVKEWPVMFGAFALAGIPTLLILKEPDLGTALVFIPLVWVMLYTLGVPVRRLLGLIGAILLASPLVWFLLKDYQRQRLLIFLNPNSDTLGAGYNVIQSTIAIGSGKWLGKGWLSGTQGQLRFVPEHHTDFIFSVLAEEWGFAGGVVLLGLYVILLWQSLRVARAARDLQGSLIAVGLTTILGTQVLINLGVASGILPVTGMTLPYISYGGSSLMVCLSMLGILMNIWSNRKVK